jgi:hypothetical protein
MTDIIERAEALKPNDHWANRGEKASMFRELIDALKAAHALNSNQANLLTEAAKRLGDARAENERLKEIVGNLSGQYD